MKTDRHIDIMGIVNLTDDSYFADSRCADADAVLMRVAGMVEDGADIVDLGACSTRPGSLPIGADEEWRRLAPVLPVLREAFPDLRISIDTYWSSVVAKAVNLGAFSTVNPKSSATVPKLSLINFTHSARSFSSTFLIII